MSAPGSDDDLKRRFSALKEGTLPGDQNLQATPGQLEDRFRVLAGHSSSASTWTRSSTSRGSFTSNATLTEDDLVNELLQQAQESARLEEKSRQLQYQQIDDLDARFARLKQYQTPSASNAKQANSSPADVHPNPQPAPQKSTKQTQPSGPRPGLTIDRSDGLLDENDDAVLGMLVQEAMNYSTDEDT